MWEQNLKTKEHVTQSKSMQSYFEGPAKATKTLSLLDWSVVGLRYLGPDQSPVTTDTLWWLYVSTWVSWIEFPRAPFPECSKSWWATTGFSCKLWRVPTPSHRSPICWLAWSAWGNSWTGNCSWCTPFLPQLLNLLNQVHMFSSVMKSARVFYRTQGSSRSEVVRTDRHFS